jgi:heat shock protein HtpX
MPSFRDLIAQNKSTSFWLVAGFCGFVVLLAILLSLAIIGYQNGGRLSDVDWGRAFVIGLIAAGVSLLISAAAYFEGDDLVLAVHGARQIRHDDDRELFNVVEEMAIAAGVPMPRVYLIQDDALNAFATGRDPAHASVAITTGLRSRLNRNELQGVLAHEMSHVANYDIRLMLLTAVLVGTVVMLCDVFWQMFHFGGGGRRRDDEDKKDGGGGGVLTLIILVLAVILAMLAPLLGQLIQLAVSRQREYLADATAVQLTRYPQGLASALRKLRDGDTALQTANRGTAHLFIANPIKVYTDWADTAFASHPPLEDRIRRLDALTHTAEPAAPSAPVSSEEGAAPTE